MHILPSYLRSGTAWTHYSRQLLEKARHWHRSWLIAAFVLMGAQVAVVNAQGVNVALQGTVIASSGDDGHAPAWAIDGNLAPESRWSVSGLPAAQFMEIDLGSVRTIDRIELIAYQDRASQFKVEARKSTSEAYSTIVNKTGNIQAASADNPVTSSFPAVEARYIKLTVTGAHGYTGPWASIVEFRVFEAKLQTVQPIDTTAGYERGAVAFARFNNIPGKTLDDLYAASKFPNKPDQVTEGNAFEFSGSGDNFGVYAWAWIIPEVTGDYTFWIASDDQGQLNLSPNSDATRAAPIASVPSNTGSRQYTRFASQQSAKVRLEAGKAYYLSALMKQGWSGTNLSVAWEGPGFSRQVIPGRVLALPKDAASETPGVGQPTPEPDAAPAPQPGTGGGAGKLTGTVNFAYYRNISGKTLNDLYRSAKFPDSPDQVQELKQFSLNATGDNFGTFAWAWLVPTVSGDYTFWIASDDQGELLLSSDANPANAATVATVDAYANFLQFDKSSTQKSRTIRLEAGRPYYIAAAMKQAWGGANLSVAWQGPGFSREVIPGSMLSADNPGTGGSAAPAAPRIIGSSGDDGHGAELAIDGSTDPESRWSVSGLPTAQWFEVDLGSIQKLNQSELIPYLDRAYQYKIEGKKNLSDGYTLLVNQTNNTRAGTVSNPLRANFNTTEVRYIKVTVTGAHGYTGPWASIVEFRVLFNANPEPEPAPAPQPSPQLKPIIGSSFDGDLTAALTKKLLEHKNINLAKNAGPDGSDAIRVSYVGNSKGSERVVVWFPIPEAMQEATLAYDVYFEHNFQWVMGGKLHGLGPENPIDGGNTRDPSGWSARVMWRENGRAETYIYDQNDSYKYGHSDVTPGSIFKQGQWYRVVLQVRVNSVGKADGFARLSVNGKQILNTQGIMYRGKDGPETLIRKLMFSTFHGGSEPKWAPRSANGNYTTVHAVYDNINVYKGIVNP